ncbi:hypothetical protein OG711_25325 [Streptomyces uncialis]|uniref:hypothetical protein n=1 Tax=Streptomyces uncialis TaxID=1048205 RepID=UPI002E32F55D|nr:hypothetical protein [Streptomyces uncialis]
MHPTSASASSPSPALPTPRARDAKGIGYPDGLPSDTLRAQVALLPTPRASANENRQTRRTPSQEAGTHGLSLAAEVCSLLPTPTAADGERTSATFGRGNPTLRGALLPTPTATDAKASSGANPAWGHGQTLTDAARSVGAGTTRRSHGGKPSPAPPPGQLTLWDA